MTGAVLSFALVLAVVPAAADALEAYTNITDVRVRIFGLQGSFGCGVTDSVSPYLIPPDAGGRVEGAISGAASCQSVGDDILIDFGNFTGWASAPILGSPYSTTNNQENYSNSNISLRRTVDLGYFVIPARTPFGLEVTAEYERSYSFDPIAQYNQMESVNAEFIALLRAGYAYFWSLPSSDGAVLTNYTPEWILPPEHVSGTIQRSMTVQYDWPAYFNLSVDVFMANGVVNTYRSPEPASLALLLTGLVAIWCTRRRRER